MAIHNAFALISEKVQNRLLKVKSNTRNIMNDLSSLTNSHFNLVQETVLEKWKRNEESLPLNKEDWVIGIDLLTKIAIESIDKKNEPIEKQNAKIKNISNSTSSLDDKIYKIKVFVEDNVETFRIFCQTGLNFSLDKSFTEKALKYVLGHDDKILSYMMTSEDQWLNEKELDVRYLSAVISLEVREIAKSCFFLLLSYKQNADNRAGYYFLWLLNRSAACSYKLPQKEKF